MEIISVLSQQFNLNQPEYVNRDDVTVDFNESAILFISGIKGAGKSRLVYEYSKQICETGDQIAIWFDAKTNDSLRNDLINNLKLTESFSLSNLNREATKVLRKVSSNVLFIFDNVTQETKEIVKQIVQLPTKKLKIILISRDPNVCDDDGQHIVNDEQHIVIEPIQIDGDYKFMPEFPYVLNEFMKEIEIQKFLISFHLIGSDFVGHDIYTKFANNLDSFVDKLKANSIVTKSYNSNGQFGLKINNYIKKELAWYASKKLNFEMKAQTVEKIFEITTKEFLNLNFSNLSLCDKKSLDSNKVDVYLTFLDNVLIHSDNMICVNTYLDIEFFKKLSEQSVSSIKGSSRLFRQFLKLNWTENEADRLAVLLKLGNCSKLIQEKVLFFNHALSMLECDEIEIAKTNATKSFVQEKTVYEHLVAQLENKNLTELNLKQLYEDFKQKLFELNEKYEHDRGKRDETLYNQNYLFIYNDNHEIYLLGEGSYGSVNLVLDITDNSK